jgi:hypothetical protein
VCSAMGIALLAGGTTLAHADKGGNGGGNGKGKGNPHDIGAIHNIFSTFGNQGIGNGQAGGNPGRSFQTVSPEGGMPGSSNAGGMSGSSNAGGGGRPMPGMENSLGSKHGKDVKEIQVKDMKEIRIKDVKEVRVKDVQDTQGEKDKDPVTIAARASEKSSDKDSGKSSDKESGKSRDGTEEDAGRSESAAAETKAVRSAPVPNCI